VSQCGKPHGDNLNNISDDEFGWTEIAGVEIKGGREKQGVDTAGVNDEGACRMGRQCRRGKKGK